MKDKKEKRGFTSWFKNVFMYHFLWPTVIGIVVVALGAVFLRDMFHRADPDFTFLVGSIDILREEDLTEIISLITDEVGDANGDGEVDVRVEIYIPTLDGSSDTGIDVLEALDLAFIGDPHKILYLFDEELSLRYEADYFESLADHGLESEDEHFYRVNELPIFERLLVVDTGYYLCLKGWRISEKDNPEYIDNYELAVRVINRLVEAD